MGFPQRQSQDIRIEQQYSKQGLKYHRIIIDFAYDNKQMRSSIPPPPPRQSDQEDTVDLPIIRTFSFQDKTPLNADHFCSTFMHIHALAQVGKRMTDPNVITFNSTQKAMVQTIVQSNVNRNDEKSKFLAQRANKFLKLLWKTEKYNDSCLEQKKSSLNIQQRNNVSTPIEKLTKKDVKNTHSLSQTKKQNSMNKATKKQTKYVEIDTKTSKQRERIKTEESRIKKISSADKKFEKIRLSPRPIKQSNERKSRKKFQEATKQKQIEIDLTQSIALQTIMTTNKFQKMLKQLDKK